VSSDVFRHNSYLSLLLRAEDSDDDPDFKRGPIEVTEKAKAKHTRSGKKRPVKESNPPHKRRKFASSKRPINWRFCLTVLSGRPGSHSLHNPLIELLGVQDDNYFQNWDSDEDAEDVGLGELEEDGGEVCPCVIYTGQLTNSLNQTEDVRNILYSHVVKREDPEIDPSATETDGSITQDEDGPPIDHKSLFNHSYDKDFIKRATCELSRAEQRAEARRLKLLEDPSATDTDSDDPTNGDLRAKTRMSDRLGLVMDDKEVGMEILKYPLLITASGCFFEAFL
jgi:hypothetical protein